MNGRDMCRCNVKSNDSVDQCDPKWANKSSNPWKFLKIWVLFASQEGGGAQVTLIRCMVWITNSFSPKGDHWWMVWGYYLWKASWIYYYLAVRIL